MIFVGALGEPEAVISRKKKSARTFLSLLKENKPIQILQMSSTTSAVTGDIVTPTRGTSNDREVSTGARLSNSKHLQSKRKFGVEIPLHSQNKKRKGTR